MKKFLRFFKFPAAVFLVNLIFALLHLYQTFEWLDIPMHFIGGLSVAYMGLLFLNYFRRKHVIDLYSKTLNFMIIISFVAFVAVLWEFFEFLLKTFFELNTQPSVADTIGDLFMGLVGAVAGWIVYGRG